MLALQKLYSTGFAKLFSFRRLIVGILQNGHVYLIFFVVYSMSLISISKNFYLIKWNTRDYLIYYRSLYYINMYTILLAPRKMIKVH